MNLKNLLRSSGIQLLLAAGVSCLLVQSANATLLFSDGFNYTAGTTIAGNGPWTGGNATLTVGNGNLTVPNLLDLGANDLSVATNPAGAGTAVALFNTASITAGTVYYSFVLSPTALPTANNYLTSLTLSSGPSGSADPLAVYVGQQTAGSTYKIGVRHQGVGSGATYAPSNAALTLNSTNFFVVAYTFGSGGSVSLWVNPTPGGSMPAADVTVAAGGTEAAGLQTVGFKAQIAGSAGNWLFDTTRIGDTWADVTPAVPEPSTVALVGAGLGLMLGLVRRRR